jgi:hypothetical protein
LVLLYAERQEEGGSRIHSTPHAHCIAWLPRHHHRPKSGRWTVPEGYVRARSLGELARATGPARYGGHVPPMGSSTPDPHRRQPATPATAAIHPPGRKASADGCRTRKHSADPSSKRFRAGLPCRRSGRGRKRGPWIGGLGNRQGATQCDGPFARTQIGGRPSATTHNC